MSEVKQSSFSSSGIKLFGATISQSDNHDQQSKKSDDNPTAEKRPDKIIPCPRCKSMATKFCYFNNYNVNQPRHFCKGCQRYWTAGGALRNVPVGAGRRKAKSLCSGGGGGMPPGFSEGCFFDAAAVERMGLFGVGEWPATERGGFGNHFTAKRRRRGGFDGQGEE